MTIAGRCEPPKGLKPVNNVWVVHIIDCRPRFLSRSAFGVNGSTAMQNPNSFHEHDVAIPASSHVEIATQPPRFAANDRASTGHPATEPTQPKPVARSGTATSLRLLTGVLYLLALLLVVQYVVPYTAERIQYGLTRGRQQAEFEVAAAGLRELPLASLSKAYQMISQHIAPSVVHIEVSNVDVTADQGEFRRHFGRSLPPSEGQGSGVIVDEEGFVMTNYHVIFGARDIRVSLSDGRRYPATVVGADPATDLAVLKIDSDNLIAAKWGDSESLEAGAMVWAIGSPFGLQRTITFGILSAKHRTGSSSNDVYQDFLQTDCAVNPGNSGGPLVDARGEVIGINTAILGEAYQGVSFAIPSSIARDIYDRLRSTGGVDRGWLGVRLDEVTEHVAEQLSLSQKGGALVHSIVDTEFQESPAGKAGLQRDDVIIRWNGISIEKPAQLIRAVAMTEIGSTATVDVIRDGQQKQFQVVLAERR